MGFTTRVKSEASEKKPFNFALFWDKYGTFFILAIIVAIFGSLSPEYFLTTNNITQIFVQSSVTVLIGMGEFFAILVAGIDLSVGAILALSGMVTAKLMLAGVDPFLAAMIGGVLVGGALGAHFLCGDWRVDHRHHQQRSEYFAGTNLLPTGGDGRINYRGCRP